MTSKASRRATRRKRDEQHKATAGRRTLTYVTLACGHGARVQIRDLPNIATVTPAPPLTLWDKARRRKPRPIIASEGLFVECTTCNTSQPVQK